MPVSPTMVKASRKTDEDRCAVFDAIDKQLMKPSVNNSFKDRVEVVVEDTLYPEDYDNIVKRYIETGWSKVTYKRSVDNGERPGLVGFTLWY